MSVKKNGVNRLAVLAGLSALAFFPVEGMSLTIVRECTVGASGTGGTGVATLPDGSTFAGFVSGVGGSVSGAWTHQTSPCPADVCDELDGASFGLCTAYCEAMDCDSVDPRADAIACAKVSSNYKKMTGGNPPPCETCTETFDLTPDALTCFLNGGIQAHIAGPGTRNGTPGYTFHFVVYDNSGPYSADTYDIKIWGPDGGLVVDASGTITSGDIVVGIP